MLRLVRWSVAGCFLALTAGCSSSSPSESVRQIDQDVVFGDDDFWDLGTSTPNDPWHERMRSTASIFNASSLSCDAGTCDAPLGTFDSVEFGGTIGNPGAKVLPLCEGEQFGGQAQGASCTAFLVAEDLVATAGHCIRTQAECDAERIVFGFAANDAAGQNIPTSFPESDVYSCTEIVARSHQGHELHDLDYAVIRLDRAVSGRTPLALRQSGLIPDGASVGTIGNYHGLALKVSDNAVVKNNPEDMPRFEVNLDAGHGNSGSPVFDLDTGLVEGILVSGPVSDNYEVVALPDGSECAAMLRCSDEEGCNTPGPSGELDWVRINRIRQVVAAVDGSCLDGELSPGETDVDCGGPMCGPCDADQLCQADSDCSAPRSLPWGDFVECWAGVCGADNRCGVDISTCECSVVEDCDDGISCTTDICTLSNNCHHVTSGCTSCSVDSDCADPQAPACEQAVCTDSGVCNNDTSACSTCTEETATDLGATGSNVTVSNNACLRVRDGYPSWWGASRSMSLQTAGGGTYPVNFSWSNDCSGANGVGVLSSDWQTESLSGIDSSCATLIQLDGDGSGSVTLRYYGG